MPMPGVGARPDPQPCRRIATLIWADLFASEIVIAYSDTTELIGHHIEVGEKNLHLFQCVPDMSGQG